ncbi:serine protease [Roseibacterium beibuensis]|uniref:Trypsin-like peptidase domain-containing protein n=1 Tax=[Roseibacterium] beibuensis TaxID=1193142 RepID=A0ABP9KWZ7_9RHOB|nr:serine protease [Roseibacterium beibuensis]MCS6621852.1 serine protease [Roseibacterium beibuensis]
MLTTFLRGILALTLVLGLGVSLAGPASAQDPDQRVWIQIESYPDLATTEQRTRAYAQLLEDVNGFRAGARFYAIALGPYARAEAVTLLGQLRAQGLIPGDSFLQDGQAFTEQFFPVGVNTLAGDSVVTTEGVVASAEDASEELAEEVVDAVAEEVAEEVVEEVTPPEPASLPEETVAEARQSEAQLTREQRDALQIALQYYGFYRGGIDGAFGPGTRAAMSAWQQSRGYEPTGILTTRQRAELLNQRAEELARLGITTVRDDGAGIEIDLPLGMVEFSEYNFPFAQYDSINDSGLQVLLISQPGDRATLFGLYEIMQTLEIVPMQGERERQGDRFLLTGQSATLRSHTEARVVGGAVKGFTLIWGPERDEDVEQILPIMQETISYFDGALDPAFVPEGAGQDIDLVSGFEVRRPEVLRTGFFIDSRGTVLTTTEAVTGPTGQCSRVLIDNAYEADIAYRDDALGIAVLRPRTALAPLDYARMAETPGRVRGEIAVAGFPFNGALSAASTSFGSISALSGVNGETTVQRLDVETADSEAGAPVIDASGAVLGMVLPGMLDGRALPGEVTLALRGDQLLPILQQAGVAPQIATPAGMMNRENLSRLGADIAVRVSCWN